MILSSKTIQKFIQKGEIVINPFLPSLLKQASYTFTLGNSIKKLSQNSLIDTQEKNAKYEEKNIEDGYTINPNEFIIAQTKEKITLSKNICMFLSTRGSIAQIGLNALQSSIFAEPETDNTITLELYNASSSPITLHQNTPIVKGIFMKIYNE